MLAALERLDHQLFFMLNNTFVSPVLDSLFWWISFVGDGAPLTIAAGVGLLVVNRRLFRQRFVWMVVAVVLGVLVVQALKYGIDRPRPLTEFAAQIQAGQVQVHVVGKPLKQRSMPSGHAQAAAAVFMYLTFLSPRNSFWWGSGFFLIAFSRLYLGVHFPSDVLVGGALGALITMGIVTLRYWQQRQVHVPRAARDAEQ